MVIGFDGSRAFVPGRTGTENYSYQLLKALAKIDNKNQYVVYLRSNNNEAWPGNFRFKTINWSRIWTQGGLAIQILKDKLDVLFVPAHTFPLIRRPGLKTVVTVHDLGSEYLPGMHQLKQRLYLGFMQKHQLKTATKIIAVSKATKEDLVKRAGIDPEKVSVIYEGYDKKLFKPVKGDTLVNTLMHYNLQPKNYYLFVGTVQPRKNLSRLIIAYSLFLKSSSSFTSSTLGNVLSSKYYGKEKNKKPIIHNTYYLPQLVIAGSKGWMADDIYELPKKLGIEDRVKFLGYVQDKDLPTLYSGAVTLTFPSLFEGFGLPILEAQACGCQVITSDASSMPEVAGKGALYVDPYSIDDIVKGMERLQVTGYRLQLIKKGFENVKRFSWEKCAKETLKVLESV